MATKRTKSIADSLLPKAEPKRELDLNALEMQVRAIHQQAENAATSPTLPFQPTPAARPPAEKMVRLSIDLTESLYFKMKETLAKRRPSLTNRAFVVSLIENELLKDE